MERWAWVTAGNLARGMTMFISAYCPCKTKQTESPYQQQKRYFNDDEIEPREKFLKDLADFVIDRHDEGQVVVVCGDMNDSIYSVRFRNCLRELGLHNAIEHKHGKLQISIQQNNYNNKTVDGIFCTIGINPIANGYDSLGIGIDSDHVQARAHFEFQDLFGKQLVLDKPEIDKLNVSDPRIMKKYNAKSFSKIKKEGLDQVLRELLEIPREEF